MRPIEQALMLSMILIVGVLIGFLIVRPAPRPTSQPDGAPSEYPSPSFTSSGVTSEGTTANGIAAEAWIGASDSGPTAARRRSEGSSPVPAPHSPAPTSRRKEPPIAKPAHRFTAGGGTRSLSGLATWYCCTRGHSASEYVAAAGPALRVGAWRGRIVQVCAVRCIRVRLVDFCRCSSVRVIDLHPGAFRQLAALSRGVARVRVSW